MDRHLTDRAEQRLRTESVIWFTTVAKSGTPAATPVWFLWRDGGVVVFTRPNSAKLDHIARNPHILLHLNCAPTGADLLTLAGVAYLDPDGPSQQEWDAYLDKYAQSISQLGMTVNSFRADYSVLVRFTPKRIRSQ